MILHRQDNTYSDCASEFAHTVKLVQDNHPGNLYKMVILYK